MKSLIDSIKDAQKKHDGEKLGELLVKLFQEEPSRWITLLYQNKVLPNPMNKNSDQILKLFYLAIPHMLQAKGQIKNIQGVILPILSIYLVFSAIREKLDNVNVWDENGAKVVFKVAVFLQNQYRLAEQKINKLISERKYFSGDILLENEVPTMFGGVNSNLIAAYEQNCENLQLILSYALYRYNDCLLGGINNNCSPYNDVEFTKLISLATFWRFYKDLWEKIIYLGWHPISIPNEDNVQIYIPRDEEEYLRFVIAGIREQEIISETANLNPQTEKQFLHITKVAKSISLPKIGNLWDGELDYEALRKSVIQESKKSNFNYGLYRHHYEALVDKVKLGNKNNQISWQIYQKAILILKVLSIAITETINKQIGREEPECLREVIIVTTNQLINIMTSTKMLSITESANAVKFLLFHPKRNHLEIWDTPLIEIEQDKILIVPALIQMGNPARAMENSIAQWNPNLFAKRGKLLEKSLKDFLLSLNIMKVQGPIKFVIANDKKIEYDLVAFWDGHLFLIEAKCTKAIFNSADAYRAKRHIEKAIDQLVVRKKAISNNWNLFCSGFPELGLPNDPINPENVHLIAVSNVLHFTSFIKDQVIVTDEFCFKRYFGDPEFSILEHSSSGITKIGSMGKVRKSRYPKADEFIKYLHDPPQVNRVRENISFQPLKLPIISEDIPKTAILHAVYEPKTS